MLHLQRFDCSIPPFHRDSLCTRASLGEQAQAGILPHVVEEAPLAPGFRGRRGPGDLAERLKPLPRESAPLQEKNSVHVFERRVVGIMNRGDKREIPAELFLKGPEGMPGEALKINVFAGILAFGVKVDHEFVENGAAWRGVDQSIEALFIGWALGVKERPGDRLVTLHPPVRNVAQVPLQLGPVSEIFELYDGHAASPSPPSAYLT
jgi:hypothetical protein